jgi:hypothetical protein
MKMIELPAVLEHNASYIFTDRRFGSHDLTGVLIIPIKPCEYPYIKIYYNMARYVY